MKAPWKLPFSPSWTSLYSCELWLHPQKTDNSRQLTHLTQQKSLPARTICFESTHKNVEDFQTDMPPTAQEPHNLKQTGTRLSPLPLAPMPSATPLLKVLGASPDVQTHRKPICHLTDSDILCLLFWCITLHSNVWLASQKICVNWNSNRLPFTDLCWESAVLFV